MLYDYLLVDTDEVKDFSQRMNYNSLTVLNAKGERILDAEAGSSFQFMRQGYFCRDTKSSGIVYNRIVGLKDSYKK